jgi:hypothetical protein
MGELIEGIMEFGTQAGEVISKIEEITEALKSLAGALDTFFNTGAFEKTFQNVVGEIESVGPLLKQAVKEGKVEELLGDAFQAAVERLGNLLFNKNFWMGVGEMWLGAFIGEEAAIGKIILNIGVALKTVLDKTFQEVYQELGKIPGLGKALGLSDSKAESFSQIYQENRDQNAFANQFLDKFLGSGGKFFTEGAKDFLEALKESLSGPAQAQFNNLVLSFAPAPTSQVPQHPGGQTSDTKGGDGNNFNVINSPDKSDSSHFKPEFTSLEKMGFIMSGGKVQNPYEQRQVDLLQQIANNTHPSTSHNVSRSPAGSQPGDWNINPIIQNTV